MSKILVTGGAGAVGRHLVKYLLARGYAVRVLDYKAGLLAGLDGDGRLELIEGVVEDAGVVRRGMEGVDTVVHLAWSFSERARELCSIDLLGHVNLLDSAVEQGVNNFIYTSSAVVYGRPRLVPVEEGHPCSVGEARKPLYAAAKLAAESLCLAYASQHRLASTVFRLWWAYGEEIGGKHLRDMIRTALAGEVVAVPRGAGGSFLDLDDLGAAVELAMARAAPGCRVYNLGSIFVTWEEVARVVLGFTGNRAPLQVVEQGAWDGPAFLTDTWQLGTRKAENELGLAVREREARAKARLEQAIERCVIQVQSVG